MSQKPQGRLSDFRNLSLAEWVQLLSAVICAIVALETSALGHRLISYLFIAACTYFSWRLWGINRGRVFAALAVLITAVSAVWIGMNEWNDYRGIEFTPSRPGELLLVVAQFDRRGSHEGVPTVVEIPEQHLMRDYAGIGPFPSKT